MVWRSLFHDRPELAEFAWSLLLARGSVNAAHLRLEQKCLRQTRHNAHRNGCTTGTKFAAWQTEVNSRNCASICRPRFHLPTKILPPTVFPFCRISFAVAQQCTKADSSREGAAAPAT